MSKTRTDSAAAVAETEPKPRRQPRVGDRVHLHSVVHDFRTARNVHTSEPARVEAVCVDPHGAPQLCKDGLQMVDLAIDRETVLRDCPWISTSAMTTPQKNLHHWALRDADGEIDLRYPRPGSKPENGDTVEVYFRDNQGRVKPRPGRVVDDHQGNGEPVRVNDLLDIAVLDDPETHPNVVALGDTPEDRRWSFDAAPSQD
jgi:hypothetical protein